ncbi:MAG: CRISPR-associated helicase Cas3' [Clostridiales Family XIII bacterium]|jgi:CRISPR-associated endonuclease/helicase Cas3|nr:CRISPR-associated helicase Cas3' [Clostridiales Family XIII bacterium]
MSKNVIADRAMKSLSACKSLWAKSERSDGSWVALYTHMADSADVALKLLYGWLPGGTMEVLERGSNQDIAEQLLVFLAAAHDLGKATPVFQLKPHISEDLCSRVYDAGFPEAYQIRGDDWNRVKHALASQLILEKYGIDRSVAVVLGGHHGKFPSKKSADTVGNAYKELLGFDSEQWRTAQRELYCYALELSGIDESALKQVKLSHAQQMIYTGIVIMSDWIASGDGDVKLPERWDIVDVDFDNTPYDFDFKFGFTASVVQSMVIDALVDSVKPGIMVIEAPMGSGKTEAALAGAEIMASKTNRSGVYFGLPTQATADGIFSRFTQWIDKVSDHKPHSIFLAHGKSAYNRNYAEFRQYDVNAEDDSNGSVYVNDWTNGRKKGLLADFTVGTIDQLLMCALKQKHVALRHLGFANKVVIIDEVHAYDAYMDSYLYKALRWLGEYNVPVIVLSATLPPATRQKLIEGYLGKGVSEQVTEGQGFRSHKVTLPPPDWARSGAYPLITYTDDTVVKQLYPAADPKRAAKVNIERFGDTDIEICEKLEDVLADGGCAGVIVNTVAKAQKLANELSERFGHEYVRLLHSAFISIDRTEKEAELLNLLGPPDSVERPHKLIVVGTQVIEQSLDIDFDVLFTEICPIDLLIQRIGRLHRHKRAVRPAGLTLPKCYVMGCDKFDSGSAAIYGEYMLMVTKYLLPDSLYLPDNIAPLVGAAYGESVEPPDCERELFGAAKEKHKARIEEKETSACEFQLREPNQGRSDLTGALDYDKKDSSDKNGESTVRDGENSVEAIILQLTKGKYRLLPWVDEGKIIPADSVPDSYMAFTLAGCKIKLPMFSKIWNIDETIKELEGKGAHLARAWRDSHWLNGELFLVLDGESKASLCGETIKYDKHTGLTVEK